MPKNVPNLTALMPLAMANGADGSKTLRYSFARAPLTPGGMVPLIREVLANQRPLKRIEICKLIIQLHLDRGGAPTDGLNAKIKRALEMLKENREIESVAFGRYIATNLNLQEMTQDADADADADDSISEFDLTIDNESSSSAPASLVALDEIGQGPQKVYVYFFENDRDLAQLQGKNAWPCKVGYTVTSVTERILGQGVTAMHSLPLLGLVIHTHDADLLERSIHNALRLAGRTMPNAPRAGTEWFHTTPAAIRAWYKVFTEALSILNGNKI